MKKLIFIIFLSLLQACVNTDAVLRNKAKAAEYAALAEKERSYGRRGMALTYDDIAKDFNERADRKLDDISFFDILLGIIFD